MRRPDPSSGRGGPSLRSGWWWAGLAALTLSTTSCDFYYHRLPSPDDLWHVIRGSITWSMPATFIPTRPIWFPAIPGVSVPVSGGEPLVAEWVSGKTTTANALKHPLAATAHPPGPSVPVIPREFEAAGDTLYQNFCTVCHGVTGNADGPVSRQMGAPSLLTPRARGYADGYLYSIIRYGRGVMPRYGDKVHTPADRWAIVNYLRRLQRAGAPVAAPGEVR